MYNTCTRHPRTWSPTLIIMLLYVQWNRRLIRGREPRTATSTFTQRLLPEQHTLAGHAHTHTCTHCTHVQALTHTHTHTHARARARAHMHTCTGTLSHTHRRAHTHWHTHTLFHGTARHTLLHWQWRLTHRRHTKRQASLMIPLRSHWQYRLKYYT